jgi:hypothetical protein
MQDQQLRELRQFYRNDLFFGGEAVLCGLVKGGMSGGKKKGA